MSNARTPIRATRARGFTLVELMVGMALGLITTLIIAQVVSSAESNRRTTTTGSDAQINGSIGLYAISRDVQAAGYGLISHSAALGCPIRARYASATQIDATLAPVSITLDSDGNPTLRTLSSGRSSFSVPMAIKANHGTTDSGFTVNSTIGISAGDMVMAIPAAWSSSMGCTVYQVQAGTAPATLTSTNVPITTVTGGNWNTNASTLTPTGGYLANSAYLVNLGQVVLREYRVTGGNLVMRSLQADGTWSAEDTVASGIVQMQLFYGKDTSATKDGVIDAYDTTTPTTADGWLRVLAVRVALVARSEQRDKDTVTGSDPRLDVGSTAPLSGTTACVTGSERKCLTLTIPRSSSTDTEWQHYRYKVYDTIVPLRNILWSAV